MSKKKATSAASRRANRAEKRRKNVETQVRRAREALTKGRTLSVDPSCHSLRPGGAGGPGRSAEHGGSQPGWALFEAGRYVESGVISISRPGALLQDRLYEIGAILREDLAAKGPFDAIIIEDIPLKRFVKKTGGKVFGSVRAQLSLHYAVAVFYASLQTTRWIKMPPQIWHTYMSDDYVKSDEGDAVAMATAAMLMLRQMTNDPHLPGARKRKTVRVKAKGKEYG